MGVMYSMIHANIQTILSYWNPSVYYLTFYVCLCSLYTLNLATLYPFSMDLGVKKVMKTLLTLVGLVPPIDVINTGSTSPAENDNTPCESGKNIKQKSKKQTGKLQRLRPNLKLERGVSIIYAASFFSKFSLLKENFQIPHDTTLNCGHSVMENNYLTLTVRLSKLSTEYPRRMASMAALSGLLKLLSCVIKKDIKVHNLSNDLTKIGKHLCWFIGTELKLNFNFIPDRISLVFISCCLFANKNDQFSKYKVKEPMIVLSGIGEHLTLFYRAPRNNKLIFYLLGRSLLMARIIKHSIRCYPTDTCNVNAFSWCWSLACWLINQGVVGCLKFRLKLLCQYKNTLTDVYNIPPLA